MDRPSHCGSFSPAPLHACLNFDQMSDIMNFTSLSAGVVFVFLYMLGCCSWKVFDPLGLLGFKLC